MILYSARHTRNLYKWKSWKRGIRKRDQANFPDASFDCVDLNRLQKGYSPDPEPGARRKICVLFVHGRGSKPKQLRRFYGAMEKALQSADYDIRGFTWPSVRGLSWYGASNRSEYPGSGTASQRSYHAGIPLERVILHLKEFCRYKRIYLVGHSLGGNVINRLRQDVPVDRIVLMSPDVLVSEWSPKPGKDVHVYVHPEDASLKWAGPDARVGRAGASDESITVHNPLEITKLRKFGHDSYAHCPDVMAHVKGLLG